MRWQAAADASCPGQLLVEAAGQDGGDTEMFRKAEENIKKKKKKQRAKGKQLRGLALKEINVLSSGCGRGRGGGVPHVSVQIRLYLASENLDNSSEASSSSRQYFSD